MFKDDQHPEPYQTPRIADHGELRHVTLGAAGEKADVVGGGVSTGSLFDPIS
jgi:hypothetical protein